MKVMFIYDLAADYDKSEPISAAIRIPLRAKYQIKTH